MKRLVGDCLASNTFTFVVRRRPFGACGCVAILIVGAAAVHVSGFCTAESHSSVAVDLGLATGIRTIVC